MQVRVEEPGQDVPAAGVDGPPRVHRLVRRQRGRDHAVADRQAALDDRVGLHDPRTFDEQVGQERSSLMIIELIDLPFLDEVSLSNLLPDFAAKQAVLLAVRAAVVIELNVEGGEVALVLRVHVGNQCFFRSALLARPNHDRRTVSIVGAQEDTPVTAQLLKPHPDVRLDVFD